MQVAFLVSGLVRFSSGEHEPGYLEHLTRDRTIALFGLSSEKLARFRNGLLDSTFFDRVHPFKHQVSREKEREILRLRSQRSMSKVRPQRSIIKLPLLDKIEDDRKVYVTFPRSEEIELKLIEYAMEMSSITCKAPQGPRITFGTS